MHAAPWWTTLAKLLRPGRTFFLMPLSTAMLLGGCVPELDEEGYSMSAVTKARRIESASARAPACDSQTKSAASGREVRIALEYERACYKQAEAKVRARLNKLQQTVTRTRRIESALALPPACDPQSNAAATAGSEPQEKVRAFHQPTSSGRAPLKTTAPSDRQDVATATTPPANPAHNSGPSAGELEVRIALEYERACYKQAEANVRARLNKLQQVVNDRPNRKVGVQSANLESASP